MVSWGQNTIYSFDKGSTPGLTNASLNVASPAPSTNAFTFGNNNASTTNTPTATSAFNFSSPSPSVTSTFPSLATPTTPSTPNTGFFGQTSSSSWAQPSSSLTYTATNPQSNIGYNSGTSAALQASMIQETSRLESNLLQLQTAYSPFVTSSTPFHTAYPMVGSSLPINTLCRFQHVFYDPITPQQQLERLHHYTSRHPNVSKEEAMSLLHTPKPTHFDSVTWSKAQACNPNPTEFVPVLLSGAEAIHSRLVYQQSKVDLYEKYLTQLSSTIEQLDQAVKASEQKLENSLQDTSMLLKQRVVDILRKVEVCRARNISLTGEEKNALERVKEVLKEVQKSESILKSSELDDKVKDYVRMQAILERSSVKEDGNSAATFTNEEYKQHVFKVLQEQRQAINALKKIVKTDSRDLQIIRTGLSS